MPVVELLVPVGDHDLDLLPVEVFHPHGGAVRVERTLLTGDGSAHLDRLEALPRDGLRPLGEVRLCLVVVREDNAGSLLLGDECLDPLLLDERANRWW